MSVTMTEVQEEIDTQMGLNVFYLERCASEPCTCGKKNPNRKWKKGREGEAEEEDEAWTARGEQ